MDSIPMSSGQNMRAAAVVVSIVVPVPAVVSVGAIVGRKFALQNEVLQHSVLHSSIVKFAALAIVVTLLHKDSL